MLERVVSSFSELHQALTAYRTDTEWVFRGHSRPDWPLVPKAGRVPYSDFDDLEMLETWKRRAIEYTQIAPKDDWDWLAIAQHHGLATRLLDWTTNPLVAAFFAVSGDGDHHVDAVIYAYYTKRVLNNVDVERPKEFKNGAVRFRPRGVAARIVRQEGLFTLHGPPTLSLTETLRVDEQLDKIIITSSYRSTLLYELFQYGVTYLSLYPDLDGLSQHVNWYMRYSSYYRISGTGQSSGASILA